MTIRKQFFFYKHNNIICRYSFLDSAKVRLICFWNLLCPNGLAHVSILTQAQRRAKVFHRYSSYYSHIVKLVLYILQIRRKPYDYYTCTDREDYESIGERGTTLGIFESNIKYLLQYYIHVHIYPYVLAYLLLGPTKKSHYLIVYILMYMYGIRNTILSTILNK